MVSLYLRVLDGGRQKLILANTRKQASEGIYYLRFTVKERQPDGTLKEKRILESVGTNLGLAILKRNSKEEALHENNYIRELKPAAVKAAKPTLGQLREQFLEQKRLTKKQDGTKLDAETLSAYSQQTEHFLKIAPRKYPEQVTGMDLRYYMNDLEEQGKSHRTIANHYTSIATFLLYCGIDHKKLLPLNERPKPHDPDPEAYTLEEIQRFLFCIERERDRLFFEFLLKTGAREREATCLEWSDLTFGDNPTVKFQSKPHLKMRIKTGKSRVVPLEGDLADRLEAFQKQNPDTKLVFGTSGDKPDTHFYETCKDTAKKAGLNKDSWWLHKFRDYAEYRTMPNVRAMTAA